MTTLEIILFSILGYILVGAIIAFIQSKQDYSNVVKDGWGRPIYVDYATRTTATDVFLIIAFWPLIILYFICGGIFCGIEELVDWYERKFK